MAIAEGINWGTVALVAMCVVLGTLCTHIGESIKSVRATSRRTELQISKRIRIAERLGKVQIRERYKSERAKKTNARKNH